MKAYAKSITYVLDDLNEIEKETKRQWDEGWRISSKGEVKKSHLYPNQKEIEIEYVLLDWQKLKL